MHVQSLVDFKICNFYDVYLSTPKCPSDQYWSIAIFGHAPRAGINLLLNYYFFFRLRNKFSQRLKFDLYGAIIA